ncbi:hypothetical protein HK100_011732 [Physocladia obscura]|uniref:Methyltransferase domain-containing protein n=1 Tax=Physocladia obscura TaxID=109957 RepID=A0AAD5T0T1_9FUNG|nr:hypothetical protein HK100_011732 [Physocladia obscura]
MGPRQSTMINKRFARNSAKSGDAFAGLQVEVQIGAEPEPKVSMSSAPPKSASVIGLPAARIDKLQAKVWNPNSPDAWETDIREYHSVEASAYALPSDEIEQNRLETQHYILQAIFHGDIVCPNAKELVALASSKVLDVGCAKGFWLQSVRKEYPLSEYHGVDLMISKDTSATNISDENNVFLKFGNVLEGLPYDDNTFDFVHQRFLTLGMPKDKFSESLQELVRVTKAGGWIEVIEGDLMVYKAGPYSKQLSQALIGAMQARGLDCYAATNLEWHARKLTEHISNAEFKTIHTPYNDDSPVGKLNGPNGKAAFLALEDWMHKSMGVTREEYRELVENCVTEWAEFNSFAQIRAFYFQENFNY